MFVRDGVLNESGQIVKGRDFLSYTDLKYLSLWWDCNYELKFAEQQFLYEKLICDNETITDVTETIYYDNKINGVLYYITTSDNWDKIEKNGFIPRNFNPDEDERPDRVRFFTELPDDDFENIVREFSDSYINAYINDFQDAKRDYAAGKISKEKLEYFYKQIENNLSWTVVKVDLNNIHSHFLNRENERYRFLMIQNRPESSHTKT